MVRSEGLNHATDMMIAYKLAMHTYLTFLGSELIDQPELVNTHIGQSYFLFIRKRESVMNQKKGELKSQL